MSEQDTRSLVERLREDADLIHAYATGVYDDLRDRIVRDLRDAADALSTPSITPREAEMPTIQAGGISASACVAEDGAVDPRG
jgi:hypothetical protein